MILTPLWRTLQSAPLCPAAWMELPLKSVTAVHWRTATETAGKNIIMYNFSSFLHTFHDLFHSSSSCVLNTMCTVTASTVIDFTGHAHSVPDRCGYTLMSPSRIPGVQVQAVFQERRRRDVSFLDRVVLQLHEGRGHISLEQGSRVSVSRQSHSTRGASMCGTACLAKWGRSW